MQLPTLCFAPGDLRFHGVLCGDGCGVHAAGLVCSWASRAGEQGTDLGLKSGTLAQQVHFFLCFAAVPRALCRPTSPSSSAPPFSGSLPCVRTGPLICFPLRLCSPLSASCSALASCFLFPLWCPVALCSPFLTSHSSGAWAGTEVGGWVGWPHFFAFWASRHPPCEFFCVLGLGMAFKIHSQEERAMCIGCSPWTECHPFRLPLCAAFHGGGRGDG